MHWISSLFFAWNGLNVPRLVFECLVWLCLADFWFCMHETTTRADILAQASLFRLGENSRNSPWFCLSFSPRRPSMVLSDAHLAQARTARLGESSRRPLVLSLGTLVQVRGFNFGWRVTSPRRGSLAQARARRGPCCRARSGNLT